MKYLHAANSRARMLSRIVAHARKRAIDNPRDNFVTQILDPGEQQSREHLIEIFDDLQTAIERLTLIDVCAAFEYQFRLYVQTAIGEAKKAVNKGYAIKLFTCAKARLIYDHEEFRGLGRPFEFVRGFAEKQQADQLTMLKEARNIAAHGLAPGALKMSTDEAYELLQDVFTTLDCG